MCDYVIGGTAPVNGRGRDDGPMSGISRSSHAYRCWPVDLDSSISSSWAPDPDGSYEHGRRHHEREEAKFRELLTAGAAEIEALIDQIEQAGHAFLPPGDPQFHQRAQRG